MASTRPQRHARSAISSYRDVFSDDDDDGFPAIAKGHVEPARKNLALKKASRSQERANAKERAEAVQLQRAIDESLSEDVSNGKIARTDHAKDVIDSEDEITAPTDSVAFRCLLDVASEAGGGKVDFVHGAADNLCNHKAIDHADLDDVVKEKSRVVLQDDDDWSIEENDKDEEVDDDSEDENSDVSEDSGCKRKRCKTKQKNKTAIDKKTKDKVHSTQAKKARSIRPVSKARMLTVEKDWSVPSVEEQVESKHFGIALQKENISANPTTKPMKNHITSRKGPGEILASCQSAPVILRNTKASKMSLMDHDPSGMLSFQAQSPNLVHRRVIGLSRRFRPPPLHPYLAK